MATQIFTMQATTHEKSKPMMVCESRDVEMYTEYSDNSHTAAYNGKLLFRPRSVTHYSVLAYITWTVMDCYSFVRANSFRL